MAVQYNKELLNRFVAPEIAGFNRVNIPDLRPSHPEAEHWMANHFLNNILRGAFTGNNRQFAVNLLVRAQSQFAQYHQARDATVEYLERTGVGSPALRLYFAAVVQWESCFLNYQIFVDLRVKMGGTKVFQLNDGSKEQRAYDISNAVKHWAGMIATEQHKDDDTIPLWLTNDGFKTRTLSLAYDEFSAITNDIADIADQMQDVRTFMAI